MTVNGRSVGRLFPRIVLSCSCVATPEDWRHGALSPTVRCRRRDGDVPGRAPRRSYSPWRRTRCDRAATSDWATGGQLPSLIRRRSPESPTSPASPPTDRRRDVCRGPDAVDTRRGRDAGVATAHLWRGRCRRSGREPTPHQAPIRPQRRSDADVRPARPYLLAAESSE